MAVSHFSSRAGILTQECLEEGASSPCCIIALISKSSWLLISQRSRILSICASYLFIFSAGYSFFSFCVFCLTASFNLLFSSQLVYFWTVYLHPLNSCSPCLQSSVIGAGGGVRGGCVGSHITKVWVNGP